MNPAHRLMAARRSSFSPTDIGWHSLFWASGPDFVAQGYSNGASITTWPNETSEANGTGGTNKPTYSSSTAAFNNKPTVAWGANQIEEVKVSAFNSNPTYPVSYVVIGKIGDDTVDCGFFDGVDGTHRNSLFSLQGPSRYQLWAGSTARTVSRADINAHFYVATFDGSTGNETLSIDGAATAISANAGSEQMTGICIGNILWAGNYGLKSGHIALLGIYSGTITSDSKWSQFKTWAASFYGLTIA